VTHVVSFLILHEITAVVPLVGLAGLFHWTGWIPDVSLTFLRYMERVSMDGMLIYGMIGFSGRELCCGRRAEVWEVFCAEGPVWV
jgi:hypothetical protein